MKVLAFLRAVVCFSIFAGIVLIGLAGLAGNAKAATVNFSGGQISGVSDLVFGGTTYNVDLVDGSCVDIFAGCDALSDLPFSTESVALDAVSAFLAVIKPVFNSAPISNDPTSFVGCGGIISQCIFNLPYALLPGNAVVGPSVSTALGVASNNGFVDLFPLQPGNWSRTASLTTSGSNVYLQFSEATVAPIPLPAALPLLGSGLGLMGLAGWWRRRRAPVE